MAAVHAHLVSDFCFDFDHLHTTLNRDMRRKRLATNVLATRILILS